jgi:hypothetical protein
MEGLDGIVGGSMDKDKIRKGIAAHERERRVLGRLLRKRGSFTEDDFDSWFRNREWRRPMRFGPPLTGDTFILGMGRNGGNKWAVMLELLQMMMALDIVDAKTVRGKVVYSLMPSNV